MCALSARAASREKGDSSIRRSALRPIRPKRANDERVEHTWLI